MKDMQMMELCIVEPKKKHFYIKKKLVKRFEECKLELHPVKTRIVYCKDKDRTKEEELAEFDFLGYTLRQSTLNVRMV